MIRSVRSVLVAVVLALAATAAPAALSAQAQYELPPEGEGPFTRHPEAVKAIDRLKSPYCPGLMLEVCPSAGGAALRDSLETMAEAGADADSLVAWVVANHGREWLALPDTRGAGLLAWIVPGLAILAGVGVVVVALRAMRRGRPQPELEREISPEEEARIAAALRELEAEERAPL